MKHIKLANMLLLLILVVIISGCSGGNTMIDSRIEKLNNDPYSNIPQERIGAIKEAITNEDSEAIYNMDCFTFGSQ